MIIFPAIDLKDGQCVRLEKGLMDKATVFNDSPADQAKIFESQGFSWIHIVDLNGAFEGKPVNSEAVKAIAKATNLKLQLGGGIRTMDTIDHWLENGIDRVILGTVALKNPALVEEACRKYPERIVVGLDAKSGFVATEGWDETSDVSVLEVGKKFESMGVAAIIYTDINRDGMLQGPDTSGTLALAKALTTPIIASGGVSSNNDIDALSTHEKDGICGVITGRALYDGRLNIAKLV